MTDQRSHARALRKDALSRARALLDLGRPRAAAREVLRALAQDPRDGEALQLYGLCLIRAGDVKEARAVLADAIGVAPTEAHNHYLLGYTERDLGEEAKAEAAYREALRLSADEPVYLRALAELLAGQKRFAEALELARKAVSLGPEKANNHVTLGFVASASGDRALARRCYEEALRLDPNDAVAWNNLGCVDLAQGRRVRARERFREALRLNPEGRLARDNLKLVAPPARPAEVYREWAAFERHAFGEICEGLRAANAPAGRQSAEVHLLALLLATEGRAAKVLARRAPQLLVLLGMSSAGLLRLLMAGPAGIGAALGTGAAAYLLSRERVGALRDRYRDGLLHARAEYERLHGEWLRGALHRRERDEAIDRLMDGLCRQIEEV